MDTSGITVDMWKKSDIHLKKLSERQSVQKVNMMDNFLPVVQGISLPVLLINGKYDPACTRFQIEYMMENVPNITRVVFENSGHFPRIEEAEKYTDTILSFLAIQ